MPSEQRVEAAPLAAAREVAADRRLVAEQEADQRRRGSRGASGSAAPSRRSATITPMTKPIGETKNSRPPKAIFTSPGVSRIQAAPKASAAAMPRKTKIFRSDQSIARPPSVRRRKRGCRARPARRPHRPAAAPRRASRPSPPPPPTAAALRLGQRAVEVVLPQPVLHARQHRVGVHALLRRQRPARDLRGEEGARPRRPRPSPALGHDARRGSRRARRRDSDRAARAIVATPVGAAAVEARPGS